MRKEGFYKVFYDGRWEVAEFVDGEWFMVKSSTPFYDNEFDFIGEKINFTEVYEIKVKNNVICRSKNISNIKDIVNSKLIIKNISDKEYMGIGITQNIEMSYYKKGEELYIILDKKLLKVTVIEYGKGYYTVKTTDDHTIYCDYEDLITKEQIENIL